MEYVKEGSHLEYSGSKNCGGPTAETSFFRLFLYQDQALYQATISIHLNSPEQTFELGVVVGSCLQEHALIGLVGQLGSGKTTFTQGLARELGVQEAVSSPTFLMLNEYYSGRLSLHHFDLYRLQNDLSSTSPAVSALKAELDEIMDGSLPAVAVVEWRDLWHEFASEYDELRLDLGYLSAGEGRRCCFSARGAGAQSLLACLEARLLSAGWVYERLNG